MSQGVERITQEISELKTVAASAKAAFDQLSQRIRENATDETALLALADELDATSNDLAAAVAANTQAADEPAEQPPVETPEEPPVEEPAAADEEDNDETPAV